MAAKVKGYVNYGCLAHEKEDIFTVSIPADGAVCWDEVEFILPDGYSVTVGKFDDELVIDPDGKRWIAQDVIHGYKNNPYMYLDTWKGIKLDYSKL